ncbi:MAG: hypothetical protein PHI06_14425 [Desulfobulbaceae bacterium]|nr:hypothetical protein [Desulfobulbaceae bacterium]
MAINLVFFTPEQMMKAESIFAEHAIFGRTPAATAVSADAPPLVP